MLPKDLKAVSVGSQLFRCSPQPPAHRPFRFRSSRARLRTTSAALRKSTDLLSDFRIPCLRIILDNVHQQKSGHPHPLRLQDSRRQHGWCSKVSSLSAAPPRRDNGGFRRRTKEKQVSRLPSFSESQKTRPFLAPPPHRGHNPARSVRCSAALVPRIPQH